MVELLGNAILANLMYVVSMFTLTYAAALLSWYVLEQHCLKLKHWFPVNGPAKRESSSQPNLRTAVEC